MGYLSTLRQWSELPLQAGPYPDYHKAFQRPINDRFNSHIFVRSLYPGHENWKNFRNHVMDRFTEYRRTVLGLIIVDTENDARELYHNMELEMMVDSFGGYETYVSKKGYDILILNMTDDTMVYKQNQPIYLEVYRPYIPYAYLSHMRSPYKYEENDLIATGNETSSTIMPSRFRSGSRSLYRNIIYTNINWWVHDLPFYYQETYATTLSNSALGYQTGMKTYGT